MRTLEEKLKAYSVGFWGALLLSMMIFVSLLGANSSLRKQNSTLEDQLHLVVLERNDKDSQLETRRKIIEEDSANVQKIWTMAWDRAYTQACIDIYYQVPLVTIQPAGDKVMVWKKYAEMPEPTPYPLPTKKK